MALLHSQKVLNALTGDTGQRPLHVVFTLKRLRKLCSILSPSRQRTRRDGLEGDVVCLHPKQHFSLKIARMYTKANMHIPTIYMAKSSAFDSGAQMPRQCGCLSNMQLSKQFKSKAPSRALYRSRDFGIGPVMELLRTLRNLRM